MRLSAFETYSLFLALRNHFNKKSYDYFKYRGKTKATMESFTGRKDRFQYQKLSRIVPADEMADFIVANLVKGRKWIGEFLDDEAKENHTQYAKRKQAITYTLTCELEGILTHVTCASELFQTRSSQYPLLLERYLSGEVSLESLVILNDFVDFVPRFDQTIGMDDIIWSKISLLIQKTQPFVEYDKKRVQELLKRVLFNHR